MNVQSNSGLQYRTAPNVLTLYIKGSQTIKIVFKSAFLARNAKRQVPYSFQASLQYTIANCSAPLVCVVVEHLG